MEKRSLQSGNTFFPVKKRRLRLSPVVFFYWKWLQDKSAQIWIHKRYCENALISQGSEGYNGFFLKIKHKPFFLIRRSLLIFIRTAPHQYSKGSFRLSLMQRPDIMSMNL
jgi:hypothetical protein